MKTIRRLLLLSLDGPSEPWSVSISSDTVVRSSVASSLTVGSVIMTSRAVTTTAGAVARLTRLTALSSVTVVGLPRFLSLSSNAALKMAGRSVALNSGATLRTTRATALSAGATVREVYVALPMVGMVSLTTGAVVADEIGVVPTTGTVSLNASAVLEAAVVVPVAPIVFGAVPMIQVTKMMVRSFDLDHLDVYWEIANVVYGSADHHAIFDYAFYVLRAGDSPLGPYEQIGGPLSDTYHFRDIAVSLQHKWRQYYYKLRVVHLPTGQTAEFGPTTFEAEQDLIATEVNRLEDMLFREFVGRRCWLYPARTFGPRCSCFDPMLNRMTRANHLPCFGTGFLGGFMSPIEAFIQIDPNPKNNQNTSLQEIQQNDTVARMISFPPVSPRDILIETENRRWRVINVTTTQRLRAVVRQELKIHEIPRGDVEYDLPMRVDHQTLVPSAERNFTNPQNLDNDGDYSDIMAAYGHPRGVLY